MAEHDQATIELEPEWLKRVEDEIGWLWAQQERSERDAVLRQMAVFIAKRPELLEVLNEGIQRLRRAFPESRSFTLTLEADPDLPNWEYIVVSIKTSLSVKEAHKCLDAFAAAWWLEHIAQFGDVLLFDVEYV